MEGILLNFSCLPAVEFSLCNTGGLYHPCRSSARVVTMEKFTGGKIDRRNFLKLTGKAVGGLAVATYSLDKWIPQTAEAAPATTADLTKEFIEVAKSTGGLSRWGYRLSNAYNIDDSLYTVYQRAIFEKGPDGRIELRPILDELSEAGLDQQLLEGTYGVNIPLRDTEVSYNLHSLPPKIIEEVSQIRRSWLEPGDPTATLQDFGPFKVSRLQALALQQWSDGKLEGILIGDAIQRMGLIPQEAILPIPQLDGQKNPTACKALGVWEGPATYYSRAGCVGCNNRREMANGYELDDRIPTIAFMDLPLNTKVRVINMANVQSIVVPVTDRGGFGQYKIEGRNIIADLSYATKEAIGGLGTTWVQIILEDPSCN